MTETFQSIKKGVAFALICVISVSGAFLIIYGSVDHGLGITHDSVSYIHAAGTLVDSFKMEYFGYESPFIQWPPLYPVLLAFGSLMGFEPAVFAMYMNAVVFGLMILISGLWVFESTKNIIWSVGSCIISAMAYPVYYTGRFMWSEILFILFCLISIIFLDNHTQRAFNGSMEVYNDFRNLAGAAFFAALASLTRYLGLTLVMAAVIVLMLQKKRGVIKFLETIFFGVFSSFPLLVWLARNFILTGTFTGGRSPTSLSLSQVYFRFFNVVTGWIMSPNYGIAPHIVIWSLLIFILAVILKQKLFFTDKNSNKIFILTIYILVYSVYLIVTASMVAFDSINTRLLSPLYPFFVLALLFSCTVYIGGISRNRIISTILTLLFSLVFALPVLHSFTGIRNEILTTKREGTGFLASEWWKGSMIVKYVENIPQDAMIISNNPDIIYVNTGRIARFPPKPGSMYWYNTERLKENMNDFSSVYLLWFASAYNDQIMTVEDMKQYFIIIPVKEFPSGRVLRIIE